MSETVEAYVATPVIGRLKPQPGIENSAEPARVTMKLVGQPLLLSVSVFASLGVFLFGYDQGVMSGILTGPYFRAYFHHPTDFEVGTMVAILEIGALITSLLAGRAGDIFGRRWTLLVGAMVFTGGGLLQTFSTGFPSMVFGRIVSGFGIGFLSMIVPVYQSEISPAENRGKLACIEFTGNIIGYASSVWVDYFCSYFKSNWSWRMPLLVQVAIGATLALGSLLIPESPRWLLDQDYDADGMRVLADIHGEGDPSSERARHEFKEIKAGIMADRVVGDRSYAQMWRSVKSRVLLAMSSQMFAQLNGINVISYYAPLVFESAGWVGRKAILMTGINGIIYVLSTVPTWYLVDIWGRRPILLSGSVFMALSLTAIGYFLYLDAVFTPLTVVIFVVVFNAFHGYSWGPIPWLYCPEIMPLQFRVKAVSISTAANWVFNWVVGELTPVFQSTIQWRLYPMHAFFCMVSFIIVYFTYPETMGVELEEMDRLFGDDAADDVESHSLISTQGNVPEPPRPDSDGRLVGGKTPEPWYQRFLALFDKGKAREAAGYRSVETRDDQ